ncbi:MAG: DUF2330 domain-containing protein [Phycisphaerae bacterium]
MVRKIAFGTMCAVVVAAGAMLASPKLATACGGFFCQAVPIDQAGEQIIFRKDGDTVTAVILIQYEGEAEDFSWVVPVPGIPDLSVGSDLIFNPLELATRPQFTLITEGEACPQPLPFPFTLGGLAPVADSAGGVAEDNDVVVLQREVVGPFDTVVVQSEDPDALATWLADNNYDLSDRGSELIAPYVDQGMNFVALRLRQDQGTGDLQPLIMRYQSEEAMIPIRLTAVAAMPNMGILVWLLGDARGVPTNFLHVTPNYTLVNWYSGTTAAYASYQGLITTAMDEAGGQGFATDYAGRSIDIVPSLPDPVQFREELGRLNAIEDDARFIAEVVNGFVFPQEKVLEVLRRELPLDAGEDEFLYFSDGTLAVTFSPEQLAAARTALATKLQDAVITPLEASVAVFDGNPYVTRMFTTLSPEEMTLDPTFSFNPDLPDQAIERQATMRLSCTGSETSWTLTLGPGTDRDGELVIEGTGNPPVFFAGPPVIVQDSVFQTETLTTSGPPTNVQRKSFAVFQVSDDGSGAGGGSSGVNLCGALGLGCGSGVTMLLVTLLGLQLMRRRH